MMYDFCVIKRKVQSAVSATAALLE